MNQQAIMHPINSGMGDIRNNLMTMMMFKNVNDKNPKNGSGSMIQMVYMMVITGFIDLIIKYFPIILSYFMNKYTSKMTEKITHMTTDILDNTLKTKTGSVIMDIVVNDGQNVTSQAILDYITNHRNTIFVSYKRQNYLLNQKEVISLEDDYYACMIDHSGTDAPANGSASLMEVQKIEIYSFIHNTIDIRRFIDKLTYNYGLTMKNKLGNQRYFFNMIPNVTPLISEYKTITSSNNDKTETQETKRKDLSKLPPTFEFIMKPFQTNRLFTNLFGEQMETIRERVKFFINNKRWYDAKGIPYTLGILLSGPPGTGKTSTIKCIANETNRHIFNINLNSDITKKQLENLFFNENVVVSSNGQRNAGTICIPLEQRLYVLEDIDCQSNLVLDRELSPSPSERTESNESIDLSFLLNLLDGVLENPGRIVIMTSNYPERLDRALIRPGRIDVMASFDCCSHKTIIDMMEFFYDCKLTKDEKDIIYGLDEFTITPAEMSKIMFENFGNSINAFEQLKQKCKKSKETGVSYFISGSNENNLLMTKQED
jgi:ATPase family associated with various cellular activities (AAA)